MLTLRFDMHLARVTEGNVQQASQTAAAGDGGDLLALLLGGEGTPVFPLTLEAALAGDAVDEPLVEPTGDDATSASDGSALVVDAAVAAALALGGAPTPEVEATVASETVARLDAEVDASAVLESTSTAAVATGVSPEATVPAVDTTAAPAVDTTAAEQTVARVENAPAAEGTPEAATTQQADASPPAATSAGPAPVANTTLPRESAETRLATGTGAASAAVATLVARRPLEESGSSFADGGGEQPDAEPSFEHRADAVAVEAPAKRALTITMPGTAGEAMHATRREPIEVPQAIVPAPAATPTTPPESGRASVAHAPLTPGTIEPGWSERVADAVRLSALRGGGEIRLQLEPEGLGHIDVRLNLHADGVRAVIVAEHESTRALLQSQQHVLHEAFGRSELRLSGFSVDVGSNDAAAFAWQGEREEGGRTPAAPAPAGLAARSADTPESVAAPLANGRVSVRV